MPSAIVITPGTTITNGQTYNDATMRAISEPTGAIPDNSIGGAQLNVSDVQATLGVNAGKPNYFLNPNFSPSNWTLGAGPMTCASGVDTLLPRNWFARPSAGIVNLTQSTQTTSATSNGDNLKSIYSLQIAGDTTASGTVEIGQNLPPANAEPLAQPIAISFYLYNAAGSSVTPVINFYTPSAFNNFTTFSSVGSVSGTACPNASWTKVTATIDATGWSNIGYGLRVTVQMPTATLNNSGKSIILSQMKIETGGVTPFVPERESGLLPLGENAFKNGNLADDFWTGAAVTADSGTLTAGGPYACQEWFGLPQAGVATYDRAASGVAGSDWAAVLTGVSGTLSTSIFGQFVKKAVAGLCAQKMTFSAYVYNATGSAFAPVLCAEASPGVNIWPADFGGGGAHGVLQKTLQTCAASQWTLVSASFDASSWSNISNGFRIYLQVPILASQSVKFTRLKLEAGSEVTRQPIEHLIPERKVIMGAVKNLVMLQTSTSGVAGSCTVSIAADELILKDTAGNAVIQTALSGSVNSMAPTESFPSSQVILYIWAFWDGGSLTFKYSTSATAPVLPNNVTHKALLGALPVAAGGVVYGFVQLGNQASFPMVSLYTGVGSVTQQTVSLTGLVPPLAKSINGFVGITTTGANLDYELSTENTNQSGTQFLFGQASTTSVTIAFDAAPGTTFTLFGSQNFNLPYGANFYYVTKGTSNDKLIALLGWTL
jgi:hypothetical protein